MVNELYTHTRNYGCRLRRFTWNGVDMLTLENAKIKVAVALGKGADIVELVYKPMDIDFMWHSFNPLGGADHLPTVAASGGSFLDAYSGGWQDLCPTYGAPAHYHGGQIGIHGEACLYPWDCKVVTDEVDCVEVLLSVRLQRSPFRIEKRLKLCGDSPVLHLHEVIVNESGVAQEFMWGQHPAFGAPFSRKYQTNSPTPTAKAPTGRNHQRRDALLRQRCSTRTMVAIAKKAHQADMRI